MSIHSPPDIHYSDNRDQSDGGQQKDMPQQRNRRNRNRNRNRRRNSKNQDNRQRTDSLVSQDRYNEGHYRSRGLSIVSGISGHSGTTNGSKRGHRESSHYDSDYGQHSNEPQRERTVRWDRDRLSREIWEYYEDNCQTQDLLTRKCRLKDALHKILVTHFPNYDIGLYIVGSTATGLADNNSDIDICIAMNEIEPKSTPEEEKTEEEYSVFGDVEPLVEPLVSPVKKESPKNEDSPKTEESSKVVESPTKDELLKPEGSPKKEEPPKTEEISEPVDWPTPEELSKFQEEKRKSEDDLNATYDYDSELDKPLDRSTLTISASNGKNDPSVPMLEQIQEVLKNYNFVTKMQIILAKVPILKFNDRISGIEVTLNVNKYVSIRNTHLIHDYTKLDWRVQPLLVIIKAWAKDHSIKDAYNRSISSYSLVLMVVHYLQYACNPPVLPCLQMLDPERYDPNADISTIRMNRRPKYWKSRNELSLKELLIGFLDYYSYTFCYSKDVVSVRLGQTVPKHTARTYKSDNNSFAHWKYLCIEEPFDRSNTARSVYDQVMFERILSVFRVSHYTLRRYPFLNSVMAGKQF